MDRRGKQVEDKPMLYFVVLAVTAVPASGYVDPACWSEGFDTSFCCDLRFGLRGHPHCWDSFYTFERCCPKPDGSDACDLSHMTLVNFTYTGLRKKDMLPNVRPTACSRIGGKLVLVEALVNLGEEKQRKTFLECIPKFCATAKTMEEAVTAMFKRHTEYAFAQLHKVESLHPLSSSLLASSEDSEISSVPVLPIVSLVFLVLGSFICFGRGGCTELFSRQPNVILSVSLIRIVLTLCVVAGHVIIGVEWDPPPHENTDQNSWPWWFWLGLRVNRTNVVFSMLTAYVIGATRAQRAPLPRLVRRAVIGWLRLVVYNLLDNGYRVFRLAGTDWNHSEDVAFYPLFANDYEAAMWLRDKGWVHASFSELRKPYDALWKLQIICSVLAALQGYAPRIGVIVAGGLSLGAVAVEDSNYTSWAYEGYDQLLLPGIVVYGLQVFKQSLGAHVAPLLGGALYTGVASCLLALLPNRPLASGAGLFWMMLQMAESLERQVREHGAGGEFASVAGRCVSAIERLCCGVAKLNVLVLIVVQAIILNHTPMPGHLLVVMEHCVFFVVLTFGLCLPFFILVERPAVLLMQRLLDIIGRTTSFWQQYMVFESSQVQAI